MKRSAEGPTSFTWMAWLTVVDRRRTSPASLITGSGRMATSLGVPAQPLISVVMPVYNAERYVADAIASILAQTYAQFEFIIVDDGSTDGSAAIVRAFAARDARVRPLFLTHYSIGRARNAGIALTQGGLIAHMDADDIALPERLA